MFHVKHYTSFLQNVGFMNISFYKILWKNFFNFFNIYMFHVKHIIIILLMKAKIYIILHVQLIKPLIY